MKLLQQFSDDLEALVARTSPAVVGVEHGRGHGTGLFLTPDGYVLTNRHVVRQSRRQTVTLSTGEEIKATFVGGDAPTDLAVLRAEGTDFPILPLADPKDVRMGQLVVAIGNPFRLEQSVTLGVVSAINRSITLPDGTMLEGMLQTDAAINPGNSGGPLLNTRCQVVGLNTLVLPYAQGIGFAVSASTAAWVASLLITHGKVERRYLGVAARAVALGPEQAREAGQPRGVLILKVQHGSPAEDAGLQPEDLLLSINKRAVSSVDDVQRMMALSGSPELRLDVLRKGHRRELSARVHARAEPAAA